MNMYRILLVDDDPFILESIGKYLDNKGYDVTTAENGEKAIELLKDSVFDLMITDLVMGEIDGIQVLKESKKLNPDVMNIILTGHGNMESAIDALRLNADDYLVKPCENKELNFRVTSCFEKLELKRKLKDYENILPICCVCKAIRDDTGKEPGTGKWVSIGMYLRKKAGIEISHTYCPECYKKTNEELVTS